MILAALVLAVAAAAQGPADPWGRPTHARVVAEPPRRWADLDDPRRRYRVFWDPLPPGTPVQLQQRVDGAWRTVQTDAQPGWTSRPLPERARFRLRTSEGRRWTPGLAAPPWMGPAELAQAVAPGPALLASTVGDLDRDPATGRLWAATLGGGVASVAASGADLQIWTRWQGLPHDRAVAVSAEGGRALVGTAAGLALIAPDGQVTVWDSALPDPYVQAVALSGATLWAGTFRGLAQVGPDGAVTLRMGPWSVFSLRPAQGGGMWAGYEGLHFIPDESDASPLLSDGARSAPWLPGERVYDILDLGAAGVLTASLGRGARLVDPQVPDASQGLPAYPPEGAYGLAAGPDGLWVAAGGLGLLGPGGEPVGAARGLVAGAVWSVDVAPGGEVWVGTDRGLWRLRVHSPSVGEVGEVQGAAPSVQLRSASPVPRSPWPAEIGGRAWLESGRGAFLGGPEGVRALGRPHRAAGDLVVAAGQAVVALLDDGDGGVWAVGERAVHLDRRGHLDALSLPGRATAAALWGQRLWVASADGVWRADPSGQRLELAVALPDVVALQAGPLSLWAISRGLVFQLSGGLSKPYMRTHAALSLAPVDGAVWVGTEDGLERILLGGDDPGRVEDVLGEGDAGVAMLAVAADGQGGCWFAGEDGSVGRVRADGRRGALELPDPDPPTAQALHPHNEDSVWLLTDEGTWLLRLPVAELRAP